MLAPLFSAIVCVYIYIYYLLLSPFPCNETVCAQAQLDCAICTASLAKKAEMLARRLLYTAAFKKCCHCFPCEAFRKRVRNLVLYIGQLVQPDVPTESSTLR